MVNIDVKKKKKCLVACELDLLKYNNNKSLKRPLEDETESALEDGPKRLREGLWDCKGKPESWALLSSVWAGAVNWNRNQRDDVKNDEIAKFAILGCKRF